MFTILRLISAAALAAWLLAPVALAQIEIRGSVSNLLDSRQAGASANVSGGGVSSVTITNPGSGYTAAPVITFSSPGGSGTTASGIASITNGRVTGITVITPGSGYANPPEVRIARPQLPSGQAAVTTPQFAAVGGTSLSSAGIDSRGLITPVNANSPGTLSADNVGPYPKSEDRTIPAQPVATILLARSTAGYSLASGVPRYAFGDVIERPQVSWNGSIASQDYWRTEPVRPGETFVGAYTGNLNGATQPLVATGTVTVTSASTGSKTVVVSSVPEGLISGATLLGKRVDVVNGTQITLRESASESVSTPTAKPFNAPEAFYYSPHADKVFATQPGRVVITWVSRVPDTTAPGETGPTYKFRTEVFSVASAPLVPQRTIYWTEKGFNSPPVQMPRGTIEDVNLVFNRFMPSHVPEEFRRTGDSQTNLEQEKRTLWWELPAAGLPTLKAYNHEGTVFLEYLGAVKDAARNRVFLGADVVQVRQSMQPVIIQTLLGRQLLPREGAPQPGDELLVVDDARQAAITTSPKPLYGTSYLANGTKVLHAERENLDADGIQLHWMESLEPELRFLTASPSSLLGIRWPRILAKYTQVWPTGLDDYEAVIVTDNGNGVSTAPLIPGANTPNIVFQDDPAEEEVELDITSQRLVVDYTESTDKTSRALVKMSFGGTPWYVPLYIQEQGLLRPEEQDPDGNGPATGSPAVATLSDRDADGRLDLDQEVLVGDRIEPPPGFSRAGYIASGRNYHAEAYRNPFLVGFEEGEKGAIIPVNALAGENVLKVWWFKEVRAPGNSFSSFHLPSRIGRYTVKYPHAAPQIVIASGIGTGDLSPAQQAGSIYVQNDPAEAGFNPNEEHALLLGSRAYALRVDLNKSTSSQAYVLLSYHSAVDQRPAMAVWKVVAETPQYPLRYDVIAGTKIQPPAPLFALPLPLQDNRSKNREVAVSSEQVATDLPDAYQGYTFEDRQGYHWLYRGSHAKSSAAAVAGISGGIVTQLQVSSPGSGYSSPPEVIVAPPAATNGQQAKATANLDAAGRVTGFTITSGGSGYVTAPEVRIAAPVSFGMQFYYKSLPGFYEPDRHTQRPVGTIMPFLKDTDTNGDDATETPETLVYQPKWPDDPTLPVDRRQVVPVLQTAQTLTLPRASAIAGQLPQVRGASSAQIIYQQSIAIGGTGKKSAILHDPTRRKTYPFGTPLDKLPSSILTTRHAGKIYFQTLPPHLQQRFFFDPAIGANGALVLEGEFVDEATGEDYLNLNVLSQKDVGTLRDLCKTGDSERTAWNAGIGALSTNLETFIEDPDVPGKYKAGTSSNIPHSTLAEISDPDTAVDSYALTGTGNGSGYVVLMLENGKAFTDPANPPAMHILKVDSSLYDGDLKVIVATNPLDEQVTLRHSGDFAGKPDEYEFEWRYGFPSNGTSPGIGSDNIDTGASTSTWLKPNGTLSDMIVVGGSPSATISSPAVLMGDTYFTLNYRKRVVGQAGDAGWAGWTAPVLVEGWTKRVLARINPFNQRMGDLAANAVNTDVSLLTQAGRRWEGDIALNLENINDAGLIEIYETLLNRGKNFTVGSGIDFSSANSALILAAGYLNDLYTILGNEAFADAANPTISIDDPDSTTEVNTSRFSFEGQVASALEEELALLKGRDDFTSPGMGVAPAYNRLWWNYTRGINSGEVLYATNYNIKEKAGSSTEDGVLDAADAQRMYPQGHGDAYGHYLTALKGYYKLLTHPYFSWMTSAEEVTVLGQPIQIDYKDERKFAAAAANAATTAVQTVALVNRKSHRDDPSAGWGHFRDGRVNPRSGVARHQGLDEWVSRSAQGSYLNWVMGSALLPAKDTDPNHSGVQIIDRTTVPELGQLVAAGNSLQTTIDSANSRLNPLGLSPGAIAFDISPTQLQAGESHFEQIYQRALRATLNAKGAFNQAARMTRLLRNQENQIADANTSLVDQELAFDARLRAIFGSPYPFDIGPGKTYAQGYEGPDYVNWFLVDRPSDLVTTSEIKQLTIRVPTGVASFLNNTTNLVQYFNPNEPNNQPIASAIRTVSVIPDQFAQWSQVYWPSGTNTGKRAVTGSLQHALLDSYQSKVSLLEEIQRVEVLQQRWVREAALFQDLLALQRDSRRKRDTLKAEFASLASTRNQLEDSSAASAAAAQAVSEIGAAVAEFLPKNVGLSNDVMSTARGSLLIASVALSTVLNAGSVVTAAHVNDYNDEIDEAFLQFDLEMEELGFTYEQKQQVYEYELLYRELMAAHYGVAQRFADYQRTNEALRNLLAEADGILAERATFRKRAAAKVTGYRTNDLTFRTFRNEALEQYRALYDLAGRYTYLAAKSYDYETGLLGSPAGQQVISSIVAARALGDLSGDQPQASVSTLGDAGLAGALAQLSADFSVAEGRLGINNPDAYGTLFGLRGELFRIQDDPDGTSDDDAWKQAIQQHIVADLLADPDVARYCNNVRKPDGSRAPGIVIPFASTIQHGKNFFGLPLAAGDHAYTPSSYATKIMSAGVVLRGYVGMDPYASGSPLAGSPVSRAPNALSATPYVYLIPCGTDYMLAPPLGDTNTLRSWTVHDQALPLPYNLGASAFNTPSFLTASDTLSEQAWIPRKHQAFRPVSDAGLFYSSIPAEFTNTRLVGRSVWNGKWKIVIPAYTLLADEQGALDRFVASVQDIQIFFRTYSNSGN